MFNSKKEKLFDVTKKEFTSEGTKTSTMTLPENPFLRSGMKNSFETKSGNGSFKLSSSGSDFVDDFSNLSGYKKPRSFNEVSNTMSTLWANNEDLAVRMALYSRMITRTIQLSDGSKTEESQRGQGLKNEGIMRFLWLAVYQEDTFWKNVDLLIAVGSWKDIFTLLSLDLQYNGWEGRVLDWEKFGKLILAGLENSNTSELVKKYLPQIKAKSKAKTLQSQANTLIGKWLCSLLFGTKANNESTYKQYRVLKSKGTAHQWQQLISQGKHNLVDFDSVHGRALSKLVSGKYLKNQGLETKYQEWISAKPTAKFTGYVYELFKPLGTSTHMSVGSLERYKIDTINKQFLELVDKAKNGLTENENGLIGVMDTSASMTSEVPGTGVSSYSVAKSLTLFMSYMLEGRFSDCYLEFSRGTVMKQWKGSTPIEKLCNDNSSVIDGTNFLSVADHFGKILKEGVNENEFPSGIVCFSDGEFDRSSGWGNNGGLDTQKSTFHNLKTKLKSYGFSKKYVDNFKVILWDIRNGYYSTDTKTKFEDFADTPNLFHISGLDASALAFLTGTKKLESIPKNSDELFLAAMNQEVLNMVEI